MRFHVMRQKARSGAYKRNFRHVPVKQSKTGIAQGAIPVFSDFLSRAAAPALRSARRGFGFSCTLPTTLNKNLILFNYKCRKSGGKRTSPLCRLRWPGRFAPYVFPNCASKTRPGKSRGGSVCKRLFYLVSCKEDNTAIVIPGGSEAPLVCFTIFHADNRRVVAGQAACVDFNIVLPHFVV